MARVAQSLTTALTSKLHFGLMIEIANRFKPFHANQLQLALTQRVRSLDSTNFADVLSVSMNFSNLHLVLHFLIPLILALSCYRDNWRKVFVILSATILVDLDHLLATPIYDPNRCSIGFHPLHQLPAIAIYIVGLFPKLTRLPAIGLLIHMALDFADCHIE